MLELLFGPTTVWFGIPAMVGTGFFVVRLVMVATGIDFDTGDAGGAGDGGGDDASGLDEGLDHAETASVFRFISIQTITAFAMGFGWGGILGIKTFGYDLPGASAVAIGLGGAFTWVILRLFRFMYAMESSGNVSVRDALGCHGTVTAPIPAGGGHTGRVRLTITDRQRPFAARTEGDAIALGARVRVTRVNDDNTVTVEPT